jgi:vacuolar-type H+-ATPase subunit I/STV1
MNTISKVFIVINLLIALGFAYMQMLTYATRENYKRRWDQDTQKLSGQLKVANDETAKQSVQKVLAQASAKQSETRIQDLERIVEDQSKDISGKTNEIIGLNVRLSKSDELIQAQRESIANLNKSLELTRQRNLELNTIANVARAVAFQLNVKLAELEDDYNNSQTELTRHEKTIFAMGEDLKRKDARLALVRERYSDVWKDINSDEPTPAGVLSAIVAAVHRGQDGRQTLAMLTIGKNEDLKVGMEFIIYRGASYICKVRVDRILNDMAGCRVIPESWNTQGLEIQQGDNAQNRLW